MKTNTTLFVGLFLCLMLSFTTQIQAQNLNVEGNATATKFIGDGSMLTNIDKDTLNELQKLMLSGDTLILSKDTTNVDLSAFINNWTINDGRDVVFGFNNNAGGLEGSAFGILNDASAPQSNAFGYLNTAAGLESSAFGYLNSATGSQSNAFGYSNQAPAPKSSALGYDNDATQIESSALGYNNMAMAEKSSAFGYSNQATGLESSAFGYDNTATGLGSNAFGYLNEASSNFSSAFGYGTLSNVYGLMTVGRFNDTLVGSPNTWVATDPVFVIGNGETIGTRSTAVTVLKNGNFGIGTTTPTEKLEVTGNVKATNFMGDGSMLTNIEQQDLSLSGDTLNLSNDATAVDLGAFINNWTINDGRDIAFGFANEATGFNSTAVGYENDATGNFSSAFGPFNMATQFRSTAIGYGNESTGGSSSAFGAFNVITSTESNGFGYNILSDVFGLSVIGRFNADPAGSATSWVTTDPVFIIGNGRNADNRSTAVTVLKNGSVGIGTQNPSEQLEVSSDNAVVTRIGVSNTSTGNATLRAKTVHSDYGWYSTGVDNSFRLFDFNANLDRMIVDSIGNVGIGTISPNVKLQITGGTNAFNSGGGYIINGEVNDLNLALDNNEIVARNNGAPSNLFIQNPGGNTILNGSNGGNVGIGTTNPTEKLEVIGNVKATQFIGDGSMLTGIGGIQDLSLSGETLNLTDDATPVDLSAFINNWTIDDRDIAFGFNNLAIGVRSSALGYDNDATRENSSAFGSINNAAGNQSNAVGYENLASGDESSAFGFDNEASALSSSAFGYNNQATKENSSAFGSINNAAGNQSSAVGYENLASGDGSSAFGFDNEASELYSSAFGYNNQATKENSSAFGSINNATGNQSSAVGYENLASGDESSAFGFDNKASALSSSAFGYNNEASASQSSAFGYNTVSNVYGLMAVGRYNETPAGNLLTWVNTDPIFVIGNGEDLNNRSTAVTVLKNGNVGIGTTSPTQKIHAEGEGLVNSVSLSDPTFVIQNDAGKADLLLKRGAATGGIQLNASGGALGLTGAAGGTNLIQFRTYGDSYFNGGNLGIGTTTPSQKLDVDGRARIRDLPIGGTRTVLVDSDGNLFQSSFSPNVNASDIGLLREDIESKTQIIQDLQLQLEEVKNENLLLEKRLAKIETLLSGKLELNTINSTITGASLEQNAPNPFSETTTINYFIPENIKSASLQVLDQNGRIIKRISIQDTGEGQITLQANLLSAGTYNYSLILDGQVIDTKQMVLTH